MAELAIGRLSSSSVIRASDGYTEVIGLIPVGVSDFFFVPCLMQFNFNIYLHIVKIYHDCNK